ncbi:MAG: transcriptional repressor [Rhodospirillaceae bacterium]|jgi:Fur family transcriptional regulator, ferric uptake regulator|nr:transcriptional repressor [Rhodospirillaceae bacterium]MBT4491578.1 transcriptional repressor [Rhodospirillaceae bacterium]MBT5193549.1 transcriptional repressor [Rhodospirillaceae bacterium]MBT5896916.1 transcriptional repressor [Rhodospirillaceae bacterium]MBT6429020.1 transcriptional repressor [Rhodospirillaceae bacterium]
MLAKIERLCMERGLRMTGQRRVVARVLSEADDHPDAEEIYRRGSMLDAKISIATVYRTLRIFEEAGILQRLEFGDGRARFEIAESEHHDHLIDTASGKVIEFQDAELEALQDKIAANLGYRLIGHRMELYGVPLQDTSPSDDNLEDDKNNDR